MLFPCNVVDQEKNSSPQCKNISGFIKKCSNFLLASPHDSNPKPKRHVNGENGFGFANKVHFWGELIHKEFQCERNPFHAVETRFCCITTHCSGDSDWTILLNPSCEGLCSWRDKTGVKISKKVRHFNALNFFAVLKILNLLQ